MLMVIERWSAKRCSAGNFGREFVEEPPEEGSQKLIKHSFAS